MTTKVTLPILAVLLVPAKPGVAEGIDVNMWYATNSFGDVVGARYAGPEGVFSSPPPTNAFLRVGSESLELGSLGGVSSEATGINNLMQIVGSAETQDGYVRAFLYEAGLMFDLGTLGGDDSFATAISETGLVTGASETVPFDDSSSHAFLYDGLMHDLGTLGGNASWGFGVNSVGDVVGLSVTANDEVHAFVYGNEAMMDLGTLGGTHSGAVAINEVGQVAGNSETSDGSIHAFLYSQGVMIDCGTLGGANSWAVGITSYGQIVGYAEDEVGWTLPFIYDDGQMHNLNVWLANQSVGLGGGVSSVGFFLGFQGIAVSPAGDTIAHSDDEPPVCGGDPPPSCETDDDDDGGCDCSCHDGGYPPAATGAGVFLQGCGGLVLLFPAPGARPLGGGLVIVGTVMAGWPYLVAFCEFAIEEGSCDGPPPPPPPSAYWYQDVADGIHPSLRH